MSTEEKTANVYFSESMPKFLSNLVNEALEESGATVNRVSADDMQGIVEKAVAMEETLQKVEFCGMSISMDLSRHNGGCEYMQPEISPEITRHEFIVAIGYLNEFSFRLLSDWNDDETNGDRADRAKTEWAKNPNPF